MIGYYVTEKFLPELRAEIKNICYEFGNLILAEGPRQKSVWAQNVWLKPDFHSFESITQAAKILRAQTPLWALSGSQHFRRGQLIQDQLPKLKPRVMNFLGPLPDMPLGAWMLIEKDRMIASAVTESLFPMGEVQFNENKVIPPSRAYLKLWELMSIYNICPEPGSRVVDFGSCPGGWTWVLQQIGCHVISIDKAPLDPKVAALPRIEFLKTDAFKLKPQDIGAIDWFFSDIICYPPRLYELVCEWLASGLCKNFVCTIKFQGATDFETLKKFQGLAGAEVRHLYHNKHEVTVWIKTSSLL